MKILLLSAYDAASHQHWHKSLVKNFAEHQWTVLTLPARFFSWRIRGNSLTWAYTQREILEKNYDLIIATSMTDLSTLRGFVPSLTNISTIVYVHENQFAYPSSGKEFSSVEPQITSIYTALACDKLVFNSQYNRSTFISGTQSLLKKMPDQVPKGLVDLIKQKSSVLHVPISDESFIKSAAKSGPLQIVWNHRWEWDKGPELLNQALEKLVTTDINFVMHIVGQKFRYVPEIFDQIKQKYHQNIGYFGYIESKAEYQKLLQQSDVVLSTALHDFQGIAILEGVAAGCVPVVPDRLAYPELFEQQYCYSEEDNETDNLVAMLANLANKKERDIFPNPPEVSHISWQELKEDYQQLLKLGVSPSW